MVGMCVGLRVTDNIGRKVGDNEVDNVGITVEPSWPRYGAMVGLCVGRKVGDNFEDNVGDNVGITVGSAWPRDDISVGSGVGRKVGDSVGRKVLLVGSRSRSSKKSRIGVICLEL